LIQGEIIMADLTSVRQTSDNSGNAITAAYANANYNARTGQGIAGTTHVLTVGVGGGAISQAQLNGFVRGITQGASLVTGDLSPDAFTVVGIGSFTAASSTSVVIAVQGTGTPSTTTGDYFAAATVAITATFAGLA
jgi:hypothetical protein